jgi:putative sterol carrier protein
LVDNIEPGPETTSWGTRVTKWLTAEWFERARMLGVDQTLYPGLSARIQYEVTGGPEGAVSYYWVLEDGRLQSGDRGSIDDPDVTLTMVWDDAVSMCQGDLDPNVAFMQGRMKVAGSMGLMMTLLPVTNTTEYRRLRQRIAEATEF